MSLKFEYFLKVPLAALATLIPLTIPLLSGCTNGTDGHHASENESPSFTDAVYGNNYNKHVHFQTFDGTTYITMSGSAENEPLIWAVDHETDKWTGPVRLGWNQIARDDLHGNPSMVIDDDGYIHIWYGNHGHGTSERVYARSKNPEDISRWIHPDFETHMTYPMPSVMEDGAVVVFYRAGNHANPGSDPWVIQRSGDNGLSWTEPRTILQKMPRDGTADLYAVPTKYPGENRIGIGISDEFLPGTATAHSTSHLFYVIYDVSEDAIYNAEGRRLNAPDGLSIEQLREHCLIADYDEMGNYNRRVSARPFITTNGTVYVFAPNGNPAAFAARPDDFNPEADALPDHPHGGRGRPKNYGELTYGGRPRIWRWSGDRWVSADPKPDIKRIRLRNDELIGWHGKDADTFELLRSTDHGNSWEPDAQLALPVPDGMRLKPLTNTGPRPCHPEAQAVIYEHTSLSGSARAWLWGESGIIAPEEPLSDVQVAPSVAFNLINADLRAIRKQEGNYAVSISNRYLESPLAVDVEMSTDHGDSWETAGLPLSFEVPPGDSNRIVFQAESANEGPRYPRPQLNITLSTSGDGDVVERTSHVLVPEKANLPVLTPEETDSSPELDGRLTDAAWDRNADIAGFGRMDRGRNIEPATTAWLSYDSNALYVAIRCAEPSTEDLKLEAGERDDDVWRDDSVEVMLDPAGDGTNYFQVIVNAEGTIQDAEQTDGDVDMKGLRAATQMQEGEAWVAEVAIPWEDVGLDGPPEKAALLLGRNRLAGGEHEVFQFPVSPGGNHQPDFYAPLRFNNTEE